MLGGKRVAILVLGLPLFLAPASAPAVNPELLLMPGKLSTAHQKYEDTCTQCHDRSDRNRQTRLCLDCHKQIAADISDAHGFHGKLPGIGQAQCRACHSEHLGRGGDIVKLSREQFDHEHTEFALRDAHATLVCSACHAPGAAYRKAPTTCAGCHEQQEPHRGKLGRDCASCHDATTWRHIRFEHDRTGFPLHDAHARAPCIACHFDDRYKDTPKQCISCHAPDDTHRGERGPRCGDCHGTEHWKNSKFDHARETGFALQGSHARLECQDCHRSGNLHDKLPHDCVGCHRGEDAHAGRFGEDCAGCHGNEKWQPATFDHVRDAHWELIGRHAKVGCYSCHTANIAAQKLRKECESCHRASDVHAGRLGHECEQCHTPQGWQAEVRFEHDLTRFPLLGLHVAVPCEQCHLTRLYRDVGHDCISCHRRDDVHKGGLGKDCGRCHSPNGWGGWQFDHGKETSFALTGAHGRLACDACHRKPADEVKLNTTCLACHEHDDVHLGQYGRQCERCHSTTTFKQSRLR